MAKQKGTFAINVSSGKSAGFSNIPGASSYTVTLGKQFVDKFREAKAAAKKKNKNETLIQDPPKGDSVPSGQPTGIKDPVKTTPTSDVPPAIKESAGRLGGFKVDPGKPGGIAQVKTTSKKITLADIQDPNSKTKRPIEPANIPESYKPQGDAPSSRQWSEADKAALESERPKGYIDPNFSPSPDTATSGAERLKALSAEMSSASKAKKMAKDAPVSKASPTPKKSTPPPAGKSQQFSGTSDTSHLPPTNLDNIK